MFDTKLYKWCFQHRHPIFLAGLLTFFVLPEIVEKAFFFRLRFPLVISILIFSSMLIIHTTKKKRGLAYSLVTILIIFILFWAFFKNTTEIELTSISLLFIYFTYVSYYLYKDVLGPKKVTSSVIFGAFAGYFLIGILFFFIFVLLDVAYPDTISVDMSNPNIGYNEAFYFSMITLTTIGYGDFAPTSVLGQKVAVLEGLIGQFYIAAVMATIVGKFLSNTPEKNSPTEK